MPRIRKRRLMNQINVVPYIDVTLVLLVIFMVTAPLTNPGVVDLPSTSHALNQANAPIVVTLKKDGSIVFDGKTLARDQLLLELRTLINKDPQRPAAIAADLKVQYGKVMELRDLLQQANIKKIGLFVQPAS